MYALKGPRTFMHQHRLNDLLLQTRLQTVIRESLFYWRVGLCVHLCCLFARNVVDEYRRKDVGSTDSSKDLTERNAMEVKLARRLRQWTPAGLCIICVVRSILNPYQQKARRSVDV